MVLASALVAAACHDGAVPPAATAPDRGPGLCAALAAPVGPDASVPTTSTVPGAGADLVVSVAPDATEAEIHAIGAELGSSWADVAYIDRDATYAEFTARFADQPEIADSMTPELLPTSYRVEIGAGEPAADDATVRALEALPGVDGVVRPASDAPAAAPAGVDQIGLALVVLWYPDPFDVVVQLAPDAPAADFGPIVDAVSAVGEDLTVLSGEDLYRQLQLVFGDQPGFMASVTPQLLGGSVRAFVDRPVDLGGLAQLASVRGVAYRYADAVTASLVDSLAADPDLVDRLRTVDDPLAADVLVLVDAAQRWSAADPTTRTRGAVFDRTERPRIIEAAGRVAAGVQQQCGTDLAQLAYTVGAWS